MVRVTLLDPPWRLYQRARPYGYDPVKHRATFLAHDSFLVPDSTLGVPRRIFVVWTGENDMSPNRARGLASIRVMNPEFDVVLVTPDNLNEWLVPGHRLHPAYGLLSLNHRSDVLRAYLLHHHGGGYSDLKPHDHGWADAFERFEGSDKWLAGYTELRYDMVARVRGPLGKDLRRGSTQVLGNGSFLARPRTPFTDELVAEQERRLDAWQPELAATPGDWRGKNSGYPVPWLGLMGEISGPLCLKYQRHVMHDLSLRPVLENYM